MIIAKPSIDGHRLESERIRLHTMIAKAWKAKGYTWTDAQIDAAVEAELAKRYPPKQSQLNLPGMPADRQESERPEHSTKAVSLKVYERKSGTRRDQVYDLLDRAGKRGMTREELAESLGIKDGGVSQAVRDLIDCREACEPFTRDSKAGLPVNVVVLKKHWSATNAKT